WRPSLDGEPGVTVSRHHGLSQAFTKGPRLMMRQMPRNALAAAVLPNYSTSQPPCLPATDVPTCRKGPHEPPDLCHPDAADRDHCHSGERAGEPACGHARQPRGIAAVAR